jgi:hypothetical protein
MRFRPAAFDRPLAQWIWQSEMQASFGERMEMAELVAVDECGGGSHGVEIRQPERRTPGRCHAALPYLNVVQVEAAPFQFEHNVLWGPLIQLAVRDGDSGSRPVTLSRRRDKERIGPCLYDSSEG